MKRAVFVICLLSLCLNVYYYLEVEDLRYEMTLAGDSVSKIESSISRSPAIPSQKFHSLKSLEKKRPTKIQKDEKQNNKQVSLNSDIDAEDELFDNTVEFKNFEDISIEWQYALQDYLRQAETASSGNLLQLYEKIKAQKLAAENDFFNTLSMQGKSTEVLSLTDSLKLSQISQDYLNKLEEEMGPEVYQGYSNLKAKFNTDIQNTAESSDVFYYIDF